MKTTLLIDDFVMLRLREKAAQEGTTISSLVEAALRLLLERPAPRPKLPPLPGYHLGAPQVDLANRGELCRILDEERLDLHRGSVAREPSAQDRAGASHRRRKPRA